MIPGSLVLHDNYPNPFNPTTLVRWAQPASARTRLEVFNLCGQRVRLLLDEECTAGENQYAFSAADLASGLYLIKVSTPHESAIQKVMLLK